MFTRRKCRRKDQVTVVLQTVRLPGAGLVRVPPDGQIFHFNLVKPGRRVGKYRLSLDVAADLVHIVLDKGELKACHLVLVIAAVQIDGCRRAIVLYVADVVSQSSDPGMVAVGKTDIHPVQRAVGLIVQHLPVYVIGHLQGGVLLHVHSDQEMLDLIGRSGCFRDL